VLEALSASRENGRQLLRRNDFELGIGTVARRLVGSPLSKVCHVPEAPTLHVLISDFDNQLES